MADIGGIGAILISLGTILAQFLTQDFFFSQLIGMLFNVKILSSTKDTIQMNEPKDK